MHLTFHAATLAIVLAAGPLWADDEMNALHNHTRHARDDVLYGQDRHGDHYRQPEPGQPSVRHTPVRPKFSNSDRAAYKLWCQQEERCFGLRPPEDLSHLPPGLQKRVERDKPLPAGWEKRLRPGVRIDPQVYAYAQPVTREILQALPPQPGGTILVTIDGRLVRIARSSQIILDVFKLEF